VTAHWFITNDTLETLKRSGVWVDAVSETCANESAVSAHPFAEALTADQDFDGHLTDTSRFVRSGTQASLPTRSHAEYTR
jgi:hypothetical protein